MSPSDQALLQWFSSKLNLLYYHHSPPCTGTDVSEAIIVKGCDLRVSTLLRTFKSSDGSIDVDFDPPQVVHCPESPNKYHLKINICKFRSPGDCVGSSASVVIEITSVQKPCRLEEDVPATPTYMTLHQLVFQPAKVINVSSCPNTQSSSPVIEAALTEYMRRLDEGHLSTLLAQCSPLLEGPARPDIPVTPIPHPSQPREEDFNIYLQFLWDSLTMTQHAERTKNQLTDIDLGKHVNLRLTFEGPPTVSYSPQSGEVEFRFGVVSHGSNSKQFSIRFAVGTLVTHGSSGVFTAYRISKSGGKVSCKNPDDVPKFEGVYSYEVIAKIRDKYIPLLWACGFGTLYTSLNLERVREEPQPSPGVLDASHELYMGSHTFVAAVFQASIDTHILGKVVRVVHPEASNTTTPTGDPIPWNGQTTINFTASHIRLLSDNQAILWVQVDRVAATQHSAEEDQISRQSDSLRLALHMRLQIRPPSAVSTANLSLYEVYLDTADAKLLPQYSALPAASDNATIHSLVELVREKYILRLGQDNQNVIARVPVPTIASATGYKIRTMFRHDSSAITVTNWFKIVTASPTSPPPVLLVYDMLDDKDEGPADPPSWDPFLGDRLAISTLAITKDAFIEQVILPQLARYNEVAALIPTAQLTCDCPCPSAVYLTSSGDGSKAVAKMWTLMEPTGDAFPQTYFFKRAYRVGETVSVASDVTNGGPAVSDPLLRDVFARQLYICKTENRLTISKSIDSDWTVTMTGSVELQSNDPAKVTARLTWNWAVIQSKASDIDIRPTAFKTVLDSLETEPPLEDEDTVGHPPLGEPGPDDASKKQSQALAKRLKDAFYGIVQKTSLPDPLSSMSDMVAVDGEFVLGKYVRRNEAGDLFVDLYPKVTPNASLANGDSHGGAGST